jgi:hypothetical protein
MSLGKCIGEHTAHCRCIQRAPGSSFACREGCSEGRCFASSPASWTRCWLLCLLWMIGISQVPLFPSIHSGVSHSSFLERFFFFLDFKLHVWGIFCPHREVQSDIWLQLSQSVKPVSKLSLVVNTLWYSYPGYWEHVTEVMKWQF